MHPDTPDAGVGAFAYRGCGLVGGGGDDGRVDVGRLWSAVFKLVVEEVGCLGKPLPSPVADEVVADGDDVVVAAGREVCEVCEVAAIGAAGDDVVFAVDDHKRLGDLCGERAYVDVPGRVSCDDKPELTNLAKPSRMVIQ